MSKKELKPATLLLPTPVVLVSCRDKEGKANVLTVAWTGILCSEPPMVSVAVRPSRLSHGIIRETGELVINVPSASLVEKVDYCGSVSGRDVDKLKALGLTAEKAKLVAAPLVAECPVNLECRVKQVLTLGTHDLFIAEIVAVHVDDALVDKRGRVQTKGMTPLAYCPTDHTYRRVGEVVGIYGFAKK